MSKHKTILSQLCCCLLLLLPPLAYSDENLDFSPIPQQTLLDYLAGKADFTLIDARSQEEYSAGHIWGAENVPFDSDLAASDILPTDLNAPVVVYCKSGKRAQTLQGSMMAMGYTSVRVLGPDQMLWAGELPVFNCGATAPGAVDTLQTRGGN